MKYYLPRKVTTEYLVEHQYDKDMEIICEDYEPLEFGELLHKFGEEFLSVFPSGKKVFFCKEIDKELYENVQDAITEDIKRILLTGGAPINPFRDEYLFVKPMVNLKDKETSSWKNRSKPSGTMQQKRKAKKQRNK
jgi:hypothetical protein